MDCERILDKLQMNGLKEPGTWIYRSATEVLAWAVVSTWLVAFATRSIQKENGLRDAMSWFFTNEDSETLNSMLDCVTTECDEALAICNDASSCLLLLPYILDPHGPANRSGLRRSKTIRTVRDNKRSTGVYYTPADVATYMLNEVMRAYARGSSPPQVFDPACGSGVFLRAALDNLHSTHPQIPISSLLRRIFGTDIDPLAVQAATFVLLADSITYDSDPTSPIDIWRTLRKNLSCVDALRLDPLSSRVNPPIPTSTRTNSSSDYLNSRDSDESQETRLTLSQIFPHIQETSTAIVGNPPYAKIGIRSDLNALANRFYTMARGQTASSAVFPLFIEQMIRLSQTPRSSGSMVAPLSLACNIGPQFEALRELIEHTPGTWKFAFFDREPHALFGEDVKTRNTILFWHRTEDDTSSSISSSHLRKWRSKDREKMFSSIRFTPLFSSIVRGIPKLDGDSQSYAYEALTDGGTRFSDLYEQSVRLPLALSTHAEHNTLFVAGTAYNFINVFLPPRAESLPSEYSLSEHPLHCLRFHSEQHAMLGFALLSSHLAYWWWRATQDGFHVTARFLNNLPFGSIDLSKKAHFELARCGSDLWALVRNQPVESVNKGKVSLAFPTHRFRRERTKIDDLLAPCLGLNKKFSRELRQFVDNTITVEPIYQSNKPSTN